MKKIIICPDSFKGTMSSRETAEIIAKAFRDSWDGYETVCIPIADGGEGTVEAFGADIVRVSVSGPHFEKVDSFYGMLGDTAVIELAAAAGLPMTDPLDPEKTTTYGVGELILSALDKGCRKFIIGLGGSSTNDCGCGMAAALGVKFYNRSGESFIPVGGTLSLVDRIDVSGIDPRIKDSAITTMCDIDNPLYGEKGAAYVFAPQKGADETSVIKLDNGLRHIAEVIKSCLDTDVSEIRGGGAAGGCGAGTVAFLASSLKRGIDVVLDTSGFDELIKDASLIITGEGKFDSQSIDGKAVSGIAARAKKANAPLIVLAGAAVESSEAYDMGVSAVFSIQRMAMPKEEAYLRNREDTYRTAFNLANLLKNFM